MMSEYEIRNEITQTELVIGSMLEESIADGLDRTEDIAEMRGRIYALKLVLEES